MRRIKNINNDWKFTKEEIDINNLEKYKLEEITLPHTWNNKDGQDGGNDYYRGKCYYVKELSELNSTESEYWIEFNGVAMSSDVYLNNKHVGHHDGGYSIFRVNITDVIEERNTLVVTADNSKNRSVYPQKADFTFYGGIYRDVNIIEVPKAHFALGFYGTPGMKITPRVNGNEADVKFEIYTENVVDSSKVTIEVEGIGNIEAIIRNQKAEAIMKIENVRKWDGMNDPFLYHCKATLESGDVITQDFGCRTFKMNPDRGFILNDREYRLCGVSRHQDRWAVGNAISKEMMEEDIAIIKEMGANTIRLAHYQHDQYFYDLCDQYGMIVWVEIPYITEHMPEANENTHSQMTELVVQNYNHPSIVCWGLSNEITAAGGVSEDVISNHKVLNDICHNLDKTRPTVMAHAFMLEPENDFAHISDIMSYNLYYGWYLGELEGNDRFFDEFRKKYPNEVIGLSEYGADANPAYQSPNPERGDWTESYQAVYHEHLLKMWSDRPYIWSMHCWNMFDFAADGRNEGGKPGQNQKGLVTFDRKIRKDAFFIYKAYLSKEPFVYLTGRRYVDRVEEVTEIKVYSNQPEISLFVDGKLVETQASDKIFKFKLIIFGEHEIEAVSGELKDTILIKKVEKPNLSYTFSGEIVNWFDKKEEMEREGYYSIFDTISDLRESPEALIVYDEVLATARKGYGDVAKNIHMPESVKKIMYASPLEKILKQAQKSFSFEDVKVINQKLNNIRKI